MLRWIAAFLRAVWVTVAWIAAFLLAFDIGAGAQTIGGGSTPFNGVNLTASLNPAVTAGAYVSGKSLGGLMTFAAFTAKSKPSGVLNQFTMASKTGLLIAATIYIFNTTPGTTCTDNTAFALAVGDVAKLVTNPFVLTPAVVGVGAVESFAQQTLAISAKDADGTLSTNLYVCAITAGVTPASTSEYFFGMNVLSD